MPTDSAFSSLEKFASSGSRRNARDARGRCLDATVELGREARRLGLEAHVVLLRWRLRGDPAFLDHWALALDDGRILDMTAAQVDGDPRANRRLADYPRDYGRPHRYPLAGVLEVLDRAEPQAKASRPRRLQWTLQQHLFRHDLLTALRTRSPGAALGGCAELAGTAAHLAAGWLLELAMAHAERLMGRLQR